MLNRKRSRLLRVLPHDHGRVSLCDRAVFRRCVAEPPADSTLRQAGDAHHILIGAAAASAFLSEADYSAILGSEFSQLQAENEMKFGLIHPRPDSDPNPYNFTGADALVAFAQSHNMVVRGHTLVWHNQVSKWVTEGKYTPPQLATILQGHIHTVMGHYASKVYAWDVVNEAFNDDGTMRHTIWYDQPGIGAGSGTKYIEQAFAGRMKPTRAPNFSTTTTTRKPVNKKSDAIYAMAKDFKKRGVPLDGVGFQTHVSLKFDDPEKLESFAKNLKRFAKLGLELHLTEIDVRLSDSSPTSLAAEAKLYGKITKALRAATRLQTAPNLGVHRQALLDSRLLQRPGMGLAVGRQVSEETRVRSGAGRAGEVVRGDGRPRRVTVWRYYEPQGSGRNYRRHRATRSLEDSKMFSAPRFASRSLQSSNSAASFRKPDMSRRSCTR